MSQTPLKAKPLDPTTCMPETRTPKTRTPETRRCPGDTLEGPGAPNVTPKVHLKSDQILGALLEAHEPAPWHQKGPQGHQFKYSFKHFGCRWGLQGMLLRPLGDEDAKQRRCNMQQTKKRQHAKQKTAALQTKQMSHKSCALLLSMRRLMPEAWIPAILNEPDGIIMT